MSENGEQEQEPETSPRPRTPSFHWYKDGVEFDAGDRFKCQFDEEEDSLALLFQKVTPDDAGLYTCTAKTSNGKISCSAELTVQGDVRQLLKTPEPPQVKTEITDVVASAGTSAMIEASISGYPKPQITWLHDDQEVVADSRHKFLENEEEETYALVIKNVNPEDTGNYSVKAANELGDVQSAGQLTVTSAPKFTKRLENKSVTVGQPLVLEIEFEGSPCPTVKWYKNGEEIENQDRIQIISETDGKQVLKIPEASKADAGNYSVDISNSSGQQTVFSVVTVKDQPVKFTQAMKSISVKEGESATFEVRVSSSTASVTFMLNGKEVNVDGSHIQLIDEGDGSYKLVIDAVSNTDVGSYTCVAKTDSGCQESCADLKITSQKSEPVFTQPLDDCDVEEGEKDFDMTVLVEGSPQPTIRWFINDMLIEEKSKYYRQISEETSGTYTLQIIEATHEVAGIYKCTAENSEGTSETCCVLSITQKPKFSEGLKDVIIEEIGASFTLSVSVEGLPTPDIEWSLSGSILSLEDEDRYQLTTEKTRRGFTYSVSITESTYDDMGLYECTATNCFGSVSTSASVSCKSVKEEKVEKEEEKEEKENLLEKEKIPQKEVVEEEKKEEVKEKETEEESKKTEVEAEKTEEKAAAGSSKKKSTRKPVFSSELSDVSALQNEENILLEVGISLEDGEEEPKVRWFIDDVEIVEMDGRYQITSEDGGAKHKLLIRVADEGTAGVYKCVASNENGDSETSAELTVCSKPEFMQGLEDRESLEGESISMDVVISGNPVPDIKWLRDGVEISEGNNITIEKESDTVYILTIEKVTPETSGLYVCEISNRVGSAKSSGQLLLLSKPSFEKDLKDGEGMVGENGELEVIVNGFPRPSVVWFKNGQRITTNVLKENPDNHFRLKFEPIEPEDEAEYYCEARNKVGSLESKHGKFSVLKPKESERPPTFIQGLSDMTIDAGKPLVLTCKIDGEPKPTLENIKWFKDGNPDAGRININYDPETGICTFTLNDVTDDDLGLYRCKVKTDAGERETSCRVLPGAGFEKPKFIKSLADASGELNQSNFEFVVEIEPNHVSSSKIRWFNDDIEITDSDSRFRIVSESKFTYKLIIINVDERTAGRYKCIATNKFGSDETSALFSVSSGPRFIDELRDKTLDPGMDLVLKVRVQGSPTPQVKWFHEGRELVIDGTNIRSSFDEFTSTHSLTILNTTESHLGVYSCEAYNPKGSVSCSCNISGGSGFLKPIFRTGLRDKTVNPNDTDIELLVEMAPSKIRNELKWFYNDIEISRSDERFRIMNDDASGLYRLFIKNADKESIGNFKCVASNDFGKARTACRVGYTGQERDRRDVEINIPERKPIEREPFNFTSESQ